MRKISVANNAEMSSRGTNSKNEGHRMYSKRPGTLGWRALGVQQTTQLGPNRGVLESQA